MILIGITGKSGAGKTTFSEIIAQKDNVGVIHIDDLLKEKKLKYFRFLMKRNKKGEKIKVNSNLKYVLYKNKYIFHNFMKFRAKLIERELRNKIEKLENQKEIIIIDDIFLKYLYCYKKLDRIILMKRSFNKRTKALIERDNLTKREIAIYDIAHYKGNYKQEENNNIIKIENNNDINQLNIIADKVYEEISRKRNYVFQKKYKINNRNMTKARNSIIKKDKNNMRCKEL